VAHEGITVLQDVDFEFVHVQNPEEVSVKITLNPGLMKDRRGANGGLTANEARQACWAQPTIRLRGAHDGLQFLQNLIPKGNELQGGGGHWH